MNTNLSVKQSTLLNTAINLALKSEMNCQHAAMIVMNGKVISCGVNHERGCLNGKGLAFMHAEVAALWRLVRQDKQCFLCK